MTTLTQTTSIRSLPKTVAHTSRLPALDAARFIAALAVIWIHVAMSPAASGTTVLARFAVPFFAAASAFFMLIRPAKSDQSFGAFLVARLKRLYLPFLVWSIAYVGLKIIKRVMLPGADCDLPGWEVFIIGGAYHLWFVPYLLLASCVLFYIERIVTEFPQHLIVTAASLGFIGAIVATVVNRLSMPDAVWVYMLQATPALCWGGTLALLMRLDADRKQQKFELALVAGMTFLLSQTMVLRDASRSIVLENAAGISLLTLVMYMPQPCLPVWFCQLGKVAFGIYLSHFLFVKVLEPIIDKFAIDRSVAIDGGLLLVTAIAASALSLVLARFERMRWLVT